MCTSSVSSLVLAFFSITKGPFSSFAMLLQVRYSRSSDPCLSSECVPQTATEQEATHRQLCHSTPKQPQNRMPPCLFSDRTIPTKNTVFPNPSLLGQQRRPAEPRLAEFLHLFASARRRPKEGQRSGVKRSTVEPLNERRSFCDSYVYNG